MDNNPHPNCKKCGNKLMRCTYKLYCSNCHEVYESSRYVDVEWQYIPISKFDKKSEELRSHIGCAINFGIAGVVVYGIIFLPIYSGVRLLVSSNIY